MICGVDVSSFSLEARIGPTGPIQSFPNTAEGILKLLTFCPAQGVELVAMEATGGYEKQSFALRKGFTAARVLTGVRAGLRGIGPFLRRQFVKYEYDSHSEHHMFSNRDSHHSGHTSDHLRHSPENRTYSRQRNHCHHEGNETENDAFAKRAENPAQSRHDQKCVNQREQNSDHEMENPSGYLWDIEDVRQEESRVHFGASGYAYER
jgi:hypothetical protein